VRLRKILISPFIFAHLLTNGIIKIRCVGGLPEGAKFKFIIYQAYDTYIHLVFEHESFDELKDGDVIPTLLTEFIKL